MRQLLCAAALTLCTAVQAQSSVTIYGVVDMGVSKANSGTSPNTGRADPNVWNVKQGRTSRLGFLGKEDLGGGNYARFDFRHFFTPDTGAPLAAPAPFWSAKSVLAIGGTWGEVYAGREYVPAFWVAMQGDPTAWNYVSQFGQYYGFANYNGSVLMDGSGIRHSNMVGYKSPTIGGFRTDLSVAAGEGSARRRTFDGSFVYESGPVYAGLGFDGQDGDNRLYVLAAGYDFGFVRPTVTYTDAKGGFSPTAYTPTPLYEAKSYQLSFTFPVSTGKLFFGGAHLNPQGANNDSTKLMAGYEHTLSKRTILYTNFGSAKKDGLTRSNVFDLGVSHAF